MSSAKSIGGAETGRALRNGAGIRRNRSPWRLPAEGRTQPIDIYETPLRAALATAKRVLRIEAEAIAGLIDRLDERFEKAVELLYACKGRIVVTGLGKSGLIGRKIAATFASTGSPSFFLHAAEALHGDLGMLTADDILARDFVERRNRRTGRVGGGGEAPGHPPDHAHGEAAIDSRLRQRHRARYRREGRSLLAESRAHCLHRRRSGHGRRARHRVARTPRLQGRRFCRAASRRAGSAKNCAASKRSCTPAKTFRVCSPTTKMPDVIYEMSRKGLGLAAVTEPDGRLLGIITDGDLRRVMQKRRENVLDLTAADCLTKNPVTLPRIGARGDGAAPHGREENHFRAGRRRREMLEGVLHIHDLWTLQLF